MAITHCQTTTVVKHTRHCVGLLAAHLSHFSMSVIERQCTYSRCMCFSIFLSPPPQKTWSCGLKVELNLWYCYQFHGVGGLFERPTAALTYLRQCTGMFFIGCVLHVCVCWRRTLCGHRECEKLAVLTALEQFQYSVGAVGVHIWVTCRGEKRVSEGVDMQGWAEGKSVIPKCPMAIKIIPNF